MITTFFKPRYDKKKTYRGFIILLFLLAIKNPIYAAEKKELILHVNNLTDFSVFIQKNSYGGINVGEILPKEQTDIIVNHFLDDSEDIDFYYSLNLKYESLLIKSLKSKQNYFYVKASEKEYNVLIEKPYEVDFNKIGIIVKNESNKSLSILNRKSFITFNVYENEIGNTIPANSTASFIKDKNELTSQLQIYDTNIFFPLISFKNGYIYKFIYDGNKIMLSDIRPILEIAQGTWEIPLEKEINITNMQYDNQLQQIIFSGLDDKETFIHSIDNKNSIHEYDFINNYKRVNDIIISNENRIINGLKTDNTPFLLKYSNFGELMSKEVLFENFNYISTLVCNQDLYVVGINNTNNKVSIIPIKNENKETPIMEMNLEGNIISVQTVYDESSNSIVYSLNYEKNYSELYSFNLYEKKLKKIELYEKFRVINKIISDEKEKIYCIGLKDNLHYSIFQMVNNNDNYITENLYTYNKNIKINDACIKDLNLILCGYEEISTDIKSSFCNCIDLNTQNELWQNKLTHIRNGQLTKIVPYADYGFIAAYVSLDNSGIIRLTETGKITDDHQILEASIIFKSNVPGILYINGVEQRSVLEGEKFSLSLLPRNYLIEYKDPNNNLLDFYEIELKTNDIKNITLQNNSNMYMTIEDSNISYRIINNAKGLELNGKGAIKKQDWILDNSIKKNEIETIIIGEGITTIDDSIFSGYKNLSYVKLPQSLQKIGDNAFDSCINLSYISLPDDLKIIGSRAFNSCSLLKSILIPSSVVSIGELAFDNCENLEEIIVDDNNSYYKDIEGVLYSKDEHELILYPQMKEGSNFIIPDEVTKLHKKAFYNQKKLKEITIGNNVSNIEDNVFSFCKLKQFIVLDNNKSFKSKDGVLFNFSSSRLISYPSSKQIDSYSISSGICIIEENAFSNTQYLKYLEIWDPVNLDIKNQQFSKNLIIVVQNQYIKDYKEKEIFKSIQNNFLSMDDYRKLRNEKQKKELADSKKRESQRKREKAFNNFQTRVKDFFTPYNGWYSIEIGFHYDYNKYNGIMDISFPETFEPEYPRFGMRISPLNIFSENFYYFDNPIDFSSSLFCFDYSFSETSITTDLLQYHNLQCMFILGAAVKRRISFMVGISPVFQWEKRISSDPKIYTSGMSYRTGIGFPIDITLYVTKNFQLFSEYEYMLFPNAALKNQNTFKVGIKFNTSFEGLE